MSNIKKKSLNHWGMQGTALKPRQLKHSGRKSISVIQINVGPQDCQEWTDRCESIMANMKAIQEHHRTKNPTLKFVKRSFLADCIERAIEEYAKQEGIKLS